MNAARQLAAAGINAVLVDTSPRPGASGETFAREMGARYLPLPHADATMLSKAVLASSVSASRIRPHPFHHLLDMRDRGFRLDAVAEVEDQTAGGEIRQHVVDGAIQRSAARDQYQRIEIALHRDAALNLVADQ